MLYGGAVVPAPRGVAVEAHPHQVRAVQRRQNAVRM